MSRIMFIYLLIFIISEISSVSVAFDIKPNKNFCIGEYITEDTVAIFIIKTKSKHLTVELHDPQGNVIYSKKNHLEVRVSLTATESGNYEVYVKNNDKKVVHIDYELLSGIQAQDYSLYARESLIKPAEAAIVKLKDMSKGIIKDINKVVKSENKNLKVNDIISGIIPKVSIFTILVMISVGAIEFFFIRRYLMKRKLI